MATVFPFDSSGISSANRINNEQHVITAQNFRDYHYVIPNFAPFFEKDFTIKMQYPDSSVRTLTYGVDYYFSNQFLDASRACAKPVYGSISFLDTDTAGILSIGYNTVGGIWNITTQEITRILAEEVRNPRTTTWEQITYLPERFPVIDHEWDLVDMTGVGDVVRSIDSVRDALLYSGGGTSSGHITDYNNPHAVSKTQVGLEYVANYPVATKAQAELGTGNDLYMTPLRTKDAITKVAGDMLLVHTSKTDNPHQVTKAQISLGNVQNYLLATQTEAEAGAIDTAYMTPLRTKQAITALVGVTVNSHISNTLNPHNVTKEQVGLSNILNYAIATDQQARAGTSNDTYMTPLRTTQLVTEYTTITLDAHSSKTDNPHSVTKAQVGLGSVQNYGIATQIDAEAGASNSVYMTPLRTKQAIAIFAGSAITSHTSDTLNPHNVTKEQVGLSNVQDYAIATDIQAKAGTSNDTYMTPLRTSQLVTEYVTVTLDGHSTRIDNPHSVTKAQVGLDSVQNYGIATQLEAETGTSNSVYMTPLRTKQAISAIAISAVTSHTSNTLNPHSVTKEQVGLSNILNYAIATDVQARAGTSNDTYMTPLRTSQLVAEYVTVTLDGHSTRTDNPHSVTKAQVGLSNVENYLIATKAQAEQATLNNVYMTPLRTNEAIAVLATPYAHLSNYSNPHAVTAEQTGAYTKSATDTLLSGKVGTYDLWVAGKSKEDFIAEVLTGKSADTFKFNGLTFDQAVAAATVEYDTMYAGMQWVYSRDTIKSPLDPVIYPYKWILIGTVKATSIITEGETYSLDLSYPDSYWAITGGHKQGATAAINNALSSPLYLVQAKSGSIAGDVAFNTTRLNGSADTDVKFGYTFLNGETKIWIRTAHGYNNIQITRLTELANDYNVGTINTEVTVEPTSIVYVDAVSYATSTQLATLISRVDTIESILNSITVV